MINVNDLRVRDPFIFTENNHFYLIASRGYEEHPFEIVIYESDDLVSFKEPVVVFKESDSFWAHKDYWAPELHKYKGRYYIFASFKNDGECRGTQILVSDTLLGEYVPTSLYPVTPRDWECLDGTLFVENNKPYMVFCHEWVQINDGTICVAELNNDLSAFVGEPKVLFKATDAKWVRALFENNKGYITDGPFIKKHKDGLIMIWSSFTSSEGYALGIARSKSILGPWVQDEEPYYKDNGGHGMIFKKDDKDILVIHCPNSPWGSERMKFIDFKLED